MNILGLGLVLLGAACAQDEACVFTRDCGAVDHCKDIQDAGCLCKFGTCIVGGNPFFGRDTECNDFKDCACSAEPANCFCRDGSCISDPAEKWECHEASDCKAMEKCKDKDCTCSDNLCEFDCNTTADCLAGDFNCKETNGYTCNCTNHLCMFEKLPAECATIHDCVKNGKCANDKPCACTTDHCVEPWFVNAEWRERFPEKNCRDNSTCSVSIAQCAEGTCNCENLVKVTEWEEWGDCILN